MKRIVSFSLVVLAVLSFRGQAFGQDDKTRKDAQTAAAEAAKMLAETPETVVTPPNCDGRYP